MAYPAVSSVLLRFTYKYRRFITTGAIHHVFSRSLISSESDARESRSRKRGVGHRAWIISTGYIYGALLGIGNRVSRVGMGMRRRAWVLDKGLEYGHKHEASGMGNG